MFTTEGAFFINNVEIHQQLKLFITTMFKIKIHGERGIWMWMFVKVLLLNASSHSYQFVIILSYIFPRRPRSQISKLEKEKKRFAGLERLAETPLWLETSIDHQPYWHSNNTLHLHTRLLIAVFPIFNDNLCRANYWKAELKAAKLIHQILHITEQLNQLYLNSMAAVKRKTSHHFFQPFHFQKSRRQLWF